MRSRRRRTRAGHVPATNHIACMHACMQLRQCVSPQKPTPPTTQGRRLDPESITRFAPTAQSRLRGRPAHRLSAPPPPPDHHPTLKMEVSRRVMQSKRASASVSNTRQSCSACSRSTSRSGQLLPSSGAPQLAPAGGAGGTAGPCPVAPQPAGLAPGGWKARHAASWPAASSRGEEPCMQGRREGLGCVETIGAGRLLGLSRAARAGNKSL